MHTGAGDNIVIEAIAEIGLATVGLIPVFGIIALTIIIWAGTGKKGR